MSKGRTYKFRLRTKSQICCLKNDVKVWALGKVLIATPLSCHNRLNYAHTSLPIKFNFINLNSGVTRSEIRFKMYHTWDLPDPFANLNETSVTI